MEYFLRLSEILAVEKNEDRRIWKEAMQDLSIDRRRENGLTWYPVAIRGVEPGKGDYLTIELERTTHQDLLHQFRSGMGAEIFSNHDPSADRISGIISRISGNRMFLSLREDELPDWTRRGKLGIDAVFDENSYEEMEKALARAAGMAEDKKAGNLVRVLAGKDTISFSSKGRFFKPELNEVQNLAISKILDAENLAIVHGPPGTGKTTTLVHAISILAKQGERVLVTAPSNAAVDLLSEKLSSKGLNVVRIGNPARVSEEQLKLTLDEKMAAHPAYRDIKKLKKQAAEYRDLAQKYKRNFGPAEREQRKALFTEARNLMKETEKTEKYIIDDVLSKADVITSTLVGANHYTIRNFEFSTVFIDEAGQALEPACWIAILKAGRVIMAGDHCQLPPTIKSREAAVAGLEITLMEKLVKKYPEAVVMLEEQYRMHRTIMSFSSREFYDNALKANPAVAEHLLPGDDQPLVFIDTAGCGFEELNEQTSISNPEEAAFLVRHLSLALEKIKVPANEFPSIGIISPYRHQVVLLKEYLAGAGIPADARGRITINTIDSFQGQERDMVYISLARSNADSRIGFLSEVRRMNVAMTRARKKLVVIGDSSTLSGFRFYNDFITWAQETGGYVSAWEFLY